MLFSLAYMDDGQNETVSDWIITMKSKPNYRQCQFSAGRWRNQLKTVTLFFLYMKRQHQKKVWHWTGQWRFFSQAITLCLKLLPCFYFYLKVRDDATDSVHT